jgi:hypothetical protein
MARAAGIRALTPFYATVFLALCAPLRAAHMTPADKEQYEKLGMSETEWGMILDAKMPMSKVKDLLSSGIMISEYFRCPWKSIGMSESEWLAKRKSGLSDADMRAMKERRPALNDGAVFVNFFLPGFHQIRRHQYLRGCFMAGIALASAGLFAGQCASSRRFMPLGLCFLAPDMLWSSVDIGIQVDREQNPDAARFSGLSRPGDMTVSLVLNIR